MKKPVHISEMAQGHYDRRITPIAGLCVALGPLTISSYIPSMKAIADDLGSTMSEVQLTLSLYLISLAISQLIYGPLSDRFGRRVTLLSGLILYVTASIFGALSWNIETLMISRILQGIGACSGVVIARAIIRDYYPQKEGLKALATMGAILAVAPALGPVLGGYLESWFGWHSVFIFLSLSGALLFLTILLFLPETLDFSFKPALTPRHLIATYWSIFRNLIFWKYMLPGGVAIAGLFSYVSAANNILMQRLSLTPEIFGWVMMLTPPTFFLGSMISRRFAPEFGPDRMIQAALIIPILSSLLSIYTGFYVTPSILGIVGPVMIWTFGLGIILPNSLSGTMKPFAKHAGSASALLGFSQQFMGGVGAALLAFLGSQSNSALGFVHLGLALIGAGGYFLCHFVTKEGS